MEARRAWWIPWSCGYLGVVSVSGSGSAGRAAGALSTEPPLQHCIFTSFKYTVDESAILM